MRLSFADPQSDATPIHVLTPDGLDGFLKDQPDAHRNWAQAQSFKAKLGQTCLVPNTDGTLNSVYFGFGQETDRARGRFHIATLAAGLPDGAYTLEGVTGDQEEAALGWLLSAYVFDRYNKKTAHGARLVSPPDVDAAKITAIANAAALAQDLINTPASDMGPDNLEAAVVSLGEAHGADVNVIVGDQLLDKNFPMIHAVGRSSDQAPRLLDLTWGDPAAPKVTLVGKGVCFDTGGLNIKPGNSMGLMKKDMGGAANTIALAKMIMDLKVPIRLRLLIPAVENSISAGAFRPGDILTSRKGLTVEVNNTDAEGRLVLADALALADEDQPEHIICMATLTGAARVALGPDLPPFYTDDDALAGAIGDAARDVADPLWRMPFWTPYDPMIEPGIADLDNAPSGGFAGSITAALFLRRFVTETPSFVHFDIYGWTPSAKPARPKGGACQAARAMFEVLARKYGCP